MARDANASLGQYADEVEANSFAACLLMDERTLRDAVEGLGRTPRRSDFERLASDFDVGVQAMSIRLEGLGYYVW